MHGIGLKLWSVNTGAYMREAARLYADGVFSYIELYIVPDSRAGISEWKTLDIPYILHCPHSMNGFNLALAGNKAANIAIYRQVREYADALDASRIIFHGGIGGDIRETARQLKEFGEPRALIENKPCVAIRNSFGGKLCRGYSAAEIRHVMDVAGCGFCLDFGHAICAANSQRREPYGYIDGLLALGPYMFHLSDLNDIASEYDSHAHLGRGQLDLERIASRLPAGACVTLETDKDSKESLEDFHTDADVFNALGIHGRVADMRDMERLFELANDAEVRRSSFNQEPIPWETHQQWFACRVADPGTLFLVYENHAGEFTGQVRFDQVRDGVAVANISVTKKFRGRGISAKILRDALIKAGQFGMREICAMIKPENVASLKTFRKVGFDTVGTSSEVCNLQYAISRRP